MVRLCSHSAYALATLILVNARWAVAEPAQAPPPQHRTRETTEALERLQALLRLPPTPSIEEMGVALGLRIGDKPKHWNEPGEDMIWSASDARNPISSARFAYQQSGEYVEVNFSINSCVKVADLISILGASMNYVMEGLGGDMQIQMVQGLELHETHPDRTLFLDGFVARVADSREFPLHQDNPSNYCIKRLNIDSESFSDKPE